MVFESAEVAEKTLLEVLDILKRVLPANRGDLGERFARIVEMYHFGGAEAIELAWQMVDQLTEVIFPGLDLVRSAVCSFIQIC